MVKIKFCGGVRVVTGSMHLISTPNSKILIDCGLFQGRRDEFYNINTKFLFNPKELKHLILSHAHIDHSGNIPNLIKQGFGGRVYTTLATADLCQAMLPDSGHIQEEDIKYVNKINRRKHRPERSPLYTRKDAEDSLQYFSGIEYNRNTPVTDDIQCCFYEAGHILGSSVVVLEIKTALDKPPLRLAYAVDLGRKDLPILKDPQVPEDIDYLIIESTYGDRLHEDMEEVKGKLADAINRTVARRGKVIIPSFAMERTQEVVYFINQLLSEGLIPDLPIFVDSPLAINVTEIFGRHPECFDKEMMDQMLKGQNPFGFGRINYTRDVEKSKKLHSDPRPMIIISASGMCENGRILHHLKNNIEDPKNSILIVGFMAQNTLGRKLVAREPVVKIFGEEYQLRAEIVKLNAFSAHADKDEILEYVSGFNEKLKKIFIVHGEEEQSKVLGERLNSKGFNSCLPQLGEEIEL